jgi:hypothetical protein
LADMVDVVRSNIVTRTRGEEAGQARGIGNTGFADAKLSGRMTWMSFPSTWVLTGAAPWFWPLTNLVGP